MHPGKSAYSQQPSLIHHPHDQIETLAETDTRLEEHNGFCPKTLRLSRSFPSNGDNHRSSRSLSVHRWKEGLARASHSNLLATPEHQPGNHTHEPMRPSDHQLLPQIPPRPSSQRLRTRSLDRKPKSILDYLHPSTHHQNSHPPTNSCRRRPSLIDSSSTDSSSLSSSPPNESTQRHQAGFHSHIPIERTVLSVLPTNMRRPSIDWTGGPTGASSAANDSWQSHPSMTSSGSPQSTLATSVDSSGTPPRPRYQPRPLLLSAFGNNVRRTSLDPSSSSFARNREPSRGTSVVEQESLTNRRLAEARLEKVQQVRQERLHAREAKKLRKRAREAELEALSSSVIQGKLGDKPIPEADEDDCWSWVSCSDAAAEEESEEDESEPEEMAVVWRASLDVGRRVSKDRKALGRGHGIRLSPRALQPRPSSSRPLVPSSPPKSSFQTLSPLHFLRLAFRKRHLLTNPLRASPIGPFIFGAGLLSGIFCSVLCSSLAGRIPSSLQRRFLLPLSSTGIGLFFNLVFPSASTVPSPALGFLHPGTIGTSIGLCAQWP
ncbi:hypothetical protein PGTUg99_029597 [Puccinia graminis f. sp. tritici]|uniref:Uncharacterized protein n=1 Tax=Puccinia graminis f. sp. tritici TaxID=56615 RepID=A0A5B0RL72_PUCGR|nr:hypothetical protein PGTUg99_029597 [Puccinia graminis f. sp. tritici]